jgi:hypothetical protein
MTSGLLFSLYKRPGEPSEREPKVPRFDPKLFGAEAILLEAFGGVKSLVASDPREQCRTGEFP